MTDTPTPAPQGAVRQQFERWCREDCSPGAQSSEWYFRIWSTAWNAALDHAKGAPHLIPILKFVVDDQGAKHSWRKGDPIPILAVRAELQEEDGHDLAASPSVEPPNPSGGMVIAPDYRGYANLGTGQYLLNTSSPPDLAELVISIATDIDKAGARVVGEERANPPGMLIQPEVMAVRLRFDNVAGLDALEQCLRHLREDHFQRAAPPPTPGAVEAPAVTDEMVMAYLQANDHDQRRNHGN